MSIARAPVSWPDYQTTHGHLMGIVNVTPDSFSDGGRYQTPAAVLQQAQTLISGGASWLDIGGESTRPGATPLSIDQELQRVLPAITLLRQQYPQARLSIDTRHAPVARQALRAGAQLVNDVSGGSDPALLAATAEAEAGLVLMHMQGDPRTMQQQPTYQDVVGEVAEFLRQRVAQAVAAGVQRERILIDPGIGFGKTLEHNLTLLRNLAQLRQQVGRPLLVGLSRKSLLPNLLQRELDNQQRDQASHILHAILAPQCAMIRCHDCAGARQAMTLARAVGHGLIA